MNKQAPKQFTMKKIEVNKKPFLHQGKGSNQYKTKKKMSFYQWLIAFNALLIILIVSWAVITTKVYFDTYTWKWQVPVMFQAPLVIKHKPILSPLKMGKTSQIDSSLIDVGKIADNIYTLESSGGKNDGCRSLGKYNGYGFRQNSAEWICYDSHEQVRQLVINWIETHIKNGDLDSALCLYNKGTNESGCRYAINYKSL